jgi:hypothetical protein
MDWRKIGRIEPSQYNDRVGLIGVGAHADPAMRSEPGPHHHGSSTLAAYKRPLSVDVFSLPCRKFSAEVATAQLAQFIQHAVQAPEDR